MPTEARALDAEQAEPKTTEQTPEEKPALSNSELKSHPVFQKLTSRLAEFERAEQERKAQEEKARKEADIKLLEEQQRYKEIIAMKDRELNEALEKHTKELTSMSLRSELTKHFHNDVFLDGAVGRFQGSAEDISTYVQSLLTDEKNKSFLASHQSAGYTPPSTPGVANANDSIPIETLKKMETSSDREERIKARAYLREYRNTHGKYPY